MTFLGLMFLSVTVDPIFGRYAVLLSVIAGILELLPVIGPIIAAVPAILLAATAGLEAVVAAFSHLAVQQLENYLLVPKIQGDVKLHPAVILFALIVGGSLAGLLGAILALPVTAAARDVVRYLFRRLSPPEEAGSLEELARPRDRAAAAGQARRTRGRRLTGGSTDSGGSPLRPCVLADVDALHDPEPDRHAHE